jgi:hypothetical protein
MCFILLKRLSSARTWPRPEDHEDSKIVLLGAETYPKVLSCIAQEKYQQRSYSFFTRFLVSWHSLSVELKPSLTPPVKVSKLQEVRSHLFRVVCTETT